MYLSSITLKNFRKYAYDGKSKRGITVNFHKGLNALVGENDSGKTAIIDSIKLVLQTQSGEFLRITDEDFYINDAGEISTEFSIDCVFEGFEINEAKNFIEWLWFEKEENSGAVAYKLFLHYRAWRENGRIYTELKAGDTEDGIPLDSKARELLKCVYLRPLRDAQKEMHSGRNSRISQILFNHTLLALKTYGASLRTLLSRRFQYVFVDEYQDCSNLQRDVLDALFSGTETIFQKIGDVDQAIYNSTNDKTPVWQVEDGYMSIAHSNRYSQEIADVLSALRTNQETIISSRGGQSIKPTLLVYDDPTRLKVIPAFIQEIESNGLAKPDGIYKAIGMFEHVTGLRISDYWPSFQKKVNQQVNVHFSDYILEISSALSNGYLSLSEQWIRKLLSKVFHYVGIKDETGKEYSSTSIKQYISHNSSQIYQSLILSLSQIDDFSYSVVADKVKEIIASLLGDEWLESIPDSFIQSTQDTLVASEDSRIFYDESSISIMFDTVYGVKGETHDATLYLETETKQSSDIRRILPLLERKITQCKNELQEKSRRCVYVGFSRPRYLLCLAIQEKTYIGHETAFSSWKIIDLRTTDAH